VKDATSTVFVWPSEKKGGLPRASGHKKKEHEGKKRALLDPVLMG